MKIVNRDYERIAGKAWRDHPLPGFTLALLEEGKLAGSLALGVRDDEGAPMAEDTLFEAASLTKPLFASFFLRLRDRGILSTELPVALQCPELMWSEDPRYPFITPRMVLSHGGGFRNWDSRPAELIFDPDSRFSYSGEGYYMLQNMVERLTGAPLSELMEEEFFRPWGMDTGILWNTEIGSRMSMGFGEDDKVRKVRDSVDRKDISPEPNAAWSFYGNAKIYGDFLCRLYNEHLGLSPESFADLTCLERMASSKIAWSMGFGLVSQDPNMVWHWGDNAGFESFAVLDLSNGNGITVFTNSDKGLPLYTEICRELTGEAFFDDIADFIERV